MTQAPSIGAGNARIGMASLMLSGLVGGGGCRRGKRLTAEAVGLGGRLIRRKFVSAQHLLRKPGGIR